jgi:hypothetical protein
MRKMRRGRSLETFNGCPSDPPMDATLAAKSLLHGQVSTVPTQPGAFPKQEEQIEGARTEELEGGIYARARAEGA